MSAETKERIAILDWTRVIAAYLVVLGHLLPVSGSPVKSFIYSFHISLFFIISGALHRFNGNIQLRKYLRTILFPSVFFLFFVGVILCCFSYYSLFGMNYIDSYGAEKPSNLFVGVSLAIWHDIKNLLFGEMPVNGPVWFLYALFIVKIVADYCLLRKSNLIVILFIAPLLFTFSKYILNPFSLGRAMMALPFFLMGYLYRDVFFRFSKIKYSTVIFIVFLFLSFFCLYFNHQPSYTALEFGVLPFPVNMFFFYLAGVSGTFMIMSLCSKLKSNKHIEYVASCLISILGVQALFFKPVIGVLGKELNLSIYIVLAVIITIACCLFHYILIKYIPFLLGKVK